MPSPLSFRRHLPNERARHAEPLPRALAPRQSDGGARRRGSEIEPTTRRTRNPAWPGARKNDKGLVGWTTRRGRRGRGEGYRTEMWNISVPFVNTAVYTQSRANSPSPHPAFALPLVFTFPALSLRGRCCSCVSTFLLRECIAKCRHVGSLSLVVLSFALQLRFIIILPLRSFVCSYDADFPRMQRQICRCAQRASM